MTMEDEGSIRKEIEQLVVTNQDNLRICILSDVIDKEPMIESVLSIAKMIGTYDIDWQDFEFWFNRFSSGNWNLDQKTFSDLPIEVIENIVEKLDFGSKMRLREVSSGLRNIVDQVRPSIDQLYCGFYHKDSQNTLTLKIRQDPESDGYCKRFYDREDNFKIAFDGIKTLFSNPRLREVNEKLMEILNSLNHKIEIVHLEASLDGDLMIDLLKSVKSGTLEHIEFQGEYELIHIDRLAQLDQWKKAKTVYFRREIFDFFRCLHHFQHFEEVLVAVKSLSINDILLVKKLSIQNEKLKKFLIFYGSKPSVLEIGEALGKTTPKMSVSEELFAKSDKTDAILVVDGKKLHVNKAVLSCHSDYFDALFDSDTVINEDSIPEYPIQYADLNDFIALLSLVHHRNPILPTAKNAEILLEMADQFLLPSATRHVELFICSSPAIAQIKKLELADKYNLDILLNRAVLEYKRVKDVVAMRQFLKFSDKTKAAIFDRMIDLQSEKDKISVQMSKFIKNHPSAIEVWMFYQRGKEKDGLYERLCKIIGENGISEEEFKKQFDKMTMEDKESHRKEIKQLVVNNQANLRLCILSDVIDKKSIAESILNIARIFGTLDIDSQDFEFWFNRFSSGDWNLDQKTFSDLPLFIVSNITEKLNLPSRMRLRRVSRGLPNIVDQVKLSIDQLIYEIEQKGSQITLKIITHKFETPVESWGRCYYGEDELKIAFDGMKTLFSNPRLQLKSFHWKNHLSSEIDVQFLDIINSLNHKIEIVELSAKLNGGPMIDLLKAVKPGTLEVISFQGKFESKDIDLLAGLDQWKKAKSVCIFEPIPDFSRCLHHFRYFERVDMVVESISMNDNFFVKSLFCDKLKCVRIYTDNKPPKSEIVKALGLTKLRFKDIYFYRLYDFPGANEYLDVSITIFGIDFYGDNSL
uniref:F-box domain-containing protein n=1 Tax=Caenorhabditis tropicalis TaxID=1561998 RepID=A0A1I7UI74_9PELO